MLIIAGYFFLAETNKAIRCDVPDGLTPKFGPEYDATGERQKCFSGGADTLF